jgi:hypothetical protein
MAAAQISTYKLIRNIWPREAFLEQILKASPALGLMPKDTNFGEKIRYVTVGTSPPQGLGDFGSAKQYKTASTAEEFQVQLASYYGNFSIGGDLYRRAKFTGNKGLLRDPMERDSKGLINQARNDFSSFVHGNGGGSLGRILSTSTLSSQTITLDKGVDKRRLVKGMTLWAATTDGTSGSPLNGFATVSAVGGTATAPTVTISQSSWQDAFPGLTTTSYLFRAGAFGTSVVHYGFDAWCPSHSGSPSAFLGVTRANAADQLAGVSLPLTNKTPRQRIMLAAQAQADTGQADGRLVYLLNTQNWLDLYFELSSANMLQLTKAPSAPIGSINLGINYEAIKVMGPAGPIEVVADPWAPTAVERLLNMDTWKMASCGDWFHWDDDATPDSPMLEDAADAREIRAVGDHQIYCTNPWANVRVAVA